MRTPDPKMAMMRYAATARAFHDVHPEAEAALHNLHLDSLGLSEQAKQHLIAEQMPDVAARLSRDEAEGDKVRQLPEGEQPAALDKLQVDEQRGIPSEAAQEEEQVSKYLAARRAAGRR